MKKRLLLATDTMLQSRYRIIRQLGTGGMGAVYEAIDERIHKTVAVKETFAHNDDLRKAFEREAKLLARIEHRAFPQVTDYFADGDGYYLVMDLIRGEDFEEILNNRTEPFEPKEVCVWADEILDALETLQI
jgi:eukaryotic-like serine/threonine-protein kinase